MTLYQDNLKNKPIEMSPEEIAQSFFSDTKMYENARLGWPVERALSIHLCTIGSYDRSDIETDVDFEESKKLIIAEMLKRNDWKD
jgi:hypothetical protein